MASCPSVCMMIMLVLAFSAATISLALPYWVTTSHSMFDSTDNTTVTAGLWQSCNGDMCECLGNVTTLPYFLNVSRVVFSVSLANILVAMIVSLRYICCEACNCKLNLRSLQFSIIVQVVACMEIMGAVLTYGLLYQGSSYLGVSGDQLMLCWAYYLAVAAGGFVFFSLVMSVCETSNAKPSKHHYEKMKNGLA